MQEMRSHGSYKRLLLCAVAAASLAPRGAAAPAADAVPSLPLWGSPPTPMRVPAAFRLTLPRGVKLCTGFLPGVVPLLIGAVLLLRALSESPEAATIQEHGICSIVDPEVGAPPRPRLAGGS